MSSNALATAPAVVTLDLDKARLYLQQTRDAALGAVKGLSEAQWHFKPEADRWSIAEILEHVVFVQERVLGERREALANAPPPPADYDYQEVDSIVIHHFPDRLTKFQAPEFARPAGRWTTSEMPARLIHNCACLIEYLELTPDLRQHAVESMPIKAVSQGKYELMDGYQWVLAAAAHTERHTKQILELKADANFPSS
jgi:DinB superfamily